MAVSDDVFSSSAAPSSAFPTAPVHYVFRSRLGEGGHGEVHEAWDTRLQRSVAIKRVKPEAIAVGADLMREARMAASLHHPAFVKVHAIEEMDGCQFIVMELIPGRTLKQVVAEGRPTLTDALEWTRQVAEAMHDAHASGLVHGDIKPSNIMLEPNGKARILDFGLALRQDMLATTTVTQSEPQGTIAYMAPERLLGAQPDERGDIYALGVILYELVTGHRPFSALNGLALAAAQVQSSSDSWDYPDYLSAPLIAVVRAMTTRHPDHRIPTMKEVTKRLDGFVSHMTKRPSHPEDKLPTFHLGKKRILKFMLFCSPLLFVGIAAWTAGWPSQSELKLSPLPFAHYSESAELGHGLASLRRFDLPGELEAAESHFSRVLKRTPDNAAAVAGLSLVYNLKFASDRQDENWLQKASASAQLASNLNNQLALSHIAQGSVLDSRGKFQEALAAYEKALKLDPGNYFAWYGKVESLRHARAYQNAFAALAQATKRFPSERVFADELGTLHFERGEYVAAEKAFRRSLALQPDAVTAYANLNAALLHQGRDEEALRILQQGLQVRPSAFLYGNLGNALFVRGDYVGAAEAFENAVSPVHGSPGDYLNWANLGDTLLWLPGREQRAKEAYEKARQLLTPRLARSPQDALLLSRMGLYSGRVRDAAQALLLTERALALQSDDATIQFRAGLTFELLGNRSRALMAINEAKRLGYPTSLVESEPSLIELRRDPSYNTN